MLQYKPFLLFLLRFLATYLVLVFLYKMYLNQFQNGIVTVDGFTQEVARESAGFLSFLDPQSSVGLENKLNYVNFFYKGIIQVRVIEGCNALSIIILFISFIVAFTGKLKYTILYVLSGSLVVHLLNIARISLLIMLLHHFPQYQTFWHDILFPLIIYGTVFVLWIVWIKKFSLSPQKDEDQQ